MEIIKPEQFRQEIVSKLYNSSNYKTQNLFINMEKGIFNYAIREANSRRIIKKWSNPKFVLIYIDRVRSILSNIDKSYIQESLLNGDISPQQFSVMTHQEMDPSRWKELLEKKSREDSLKCEEKLVANTDMFTCSRCKTKNCNYYSMQTRSADEPETIFVTCIDCGKHWRS